MSDIIVLGDIHVAEKWDRIEEIIPKTIDYLNPNKYLKKIIRLLKCKDILIFNGDMVDYYYSKYYDIQGNNWDIFFNIIKIFKGKKFYNIGNHDYRKMPYNFNIYGLKHVNINDIVRKRYSKMIGFNKFRFLKELDSIAVNLKKFNPIPKRISISPKYFETKSNSVLLLNTGPDALTKISQIINPFSWKYVLSKYPSSLGLSNKEIVMLKKILSKNTKKELIIFLHCPPFFSSGMISPVKLSAISYKMMLIKNKLTYATFSKNNWKFINMILKSDRNIIVITSHSHIPKQYIIDKKTNILYESSIKEINNLRKSVSHIKFVSTLPIGAIESPQLATIGYLKITKKLILYKITKKLHIS